MEDTEQQSSTPTSVELARRNGRDEMNLAEFPVTLLADIAPKGQKTLVYRDGEQTLTITASDAYGLPTAVDADVIVALIQLTKDANNFTDPTITFTRSGLLDILGWIKNGSSYQRLAQSLKCWTGVTLNYEKAWWDNRSKKKVDATFHILESVVLNETVGDAGDRTTSTFTWNKRFFDSCRADNLKRLDLHTYFSLDSSISKRMYRFLDKRFYHRPSWTFDLQEFAYSHVGLGRNYRDNGKIKEKLAKAIAELVRIGFLEDLPAKERYQQVKRGQWTITLTRKQAEPATLEVQTQESDAESEPNDSPPALERELVARGIIARRAKSLVAQYPAERIARQIEHFDFIQQKSPGEIKKPGGFLCAAIEDDYPAMTGFVSRAERVAREALLKEQMRANANSKAAKAEAALRDQAARVQVAAYLDSLGSQELEQLDREILTNPANRESYQRMSPRFKVMFIETLRRALVRERLKLDPED